MDSFAGDLEVPDSQVTVDVQATAVVQKELHGVASAVVESELDVAVAVCEKVVYVDVHMPFCISMPPSFLELT
uniref:Uncharacterized protein n=1 Tax=Oryza brachyantha TaxID=4533 RepID=J3L618_ORYBR